MKKTIQSGNQLQKEFQEMNRDYYSPEAYDVMLNVIDEIDPDMELDVYNLLDMFEEWDRNDLLSTIDLKAEYTEDNGLSIDGNINEDEYIQYIIDSFYCIYPLSNGKYLVSADWR